ncbi:MAG: peptidoglycan-binding protein [Herminiimonas sp.]|nr:peptidoglycan-binding protein [Herminiimonas sp.]
MYTQFFRLNQAPFSIAPDPRYLFMSERHREALAHLLYGVGSGGGFVLLTGEIGAGKTTVCRCFLEQIPADCNVAYIFNPKLTVNELLQSICDEFNIAFRHEGPGGPTVKDYVDVLNSHLLAAHAEGRNNVLIIDEAQNLTPDVLEQLRLLTNLETNERKLLQIILIGQPELRAMLARPELEQLAQRVIARYHLDSLSAEETERYILHRLSIAGMIDAPPFQKKLLRKIHQLTQGVPRRINLLCDRALLGAYAEGKHEADHGIVRKAAREVFGNDRLPVPAKRQRWRYAASGLAAGAIIAGVVAWTVGNASYMNTAAARKTAAAAASDAPGKAASAAPETRAIGVAAPAQQTSRPQVPDKKSDAVQAVAESGSDSVAATPVLSNLSGMIGSGARDKNAAYRELAKLWGVSIPPGIPCDVAQKMNLHCYESGSGLAEIRQLDRPAMLTLRDDAGKTYYAVLTGLTNASATLRIDGALHTVTLVALGRRFRGDFATFWRAPQSYREKLSNGDRGVDVDWLAAQLAKLSGVKQPVANQPFDQGTIRQVREFQLVQGLEVDGIVGPKTFMHLNNAAGVNEPRLRGGAAAASIPSGK